jgi:N-acetylglucosamine repressor
MPNGNHLAILQNIRLAGQLTRRDLASQLGLGISMVSKLTGELIDRKLLREEGRSASGGGRPSDLLALNPLAGYAVGLDVGGNHLRTAVVDFCGNVVAQNSGPGPEMTSRHGILDGFETAIDSVLGLAELTRIDVLGAGISLYGSVDPTTGTVYSWTETPGLYNIWKNFNVREGFQQRWPLPHIYIDDVVRTLGIAEVLYGRVKATAEDFAFVLADTGIGAALMINRQAYVGPAQLAGELGHIPLNPERIPCSCGNVGCLETIASVNAVVGRVRERLQNRLVESSLAGLGRNVEIADIISAEKEGDTLAFRVLSEAGDYLGVGIGIMLNLFGVSHVVVGGMLATSPAYMESTRRSVRLNTLSKVAQALIIERTELDEFAAARGAASIVLNALFQPGEQNVLAVV